GGAREAENFLAYLGCAAHNGWIRQLHGRTREHRRGEKRLRRHHRPICADLFRERCATRSGFHSRRPHRGQPDKYGPAVAHRARGAREARTGRRHYAGRTALSPSRRGCCLAVPFAAPGSRPLRRFRPWYWIVMVAALIAVSVVAVARGAVPFSLSVVSE